MNQVWLNGRLASDPEGGESGSGVAYTKFQVAIEKGSGDNKEVTYLDCVAFRQTADFIKQYFQKGGGINVVGSISVKDWEDQSGVKRRRYEILVNQVGFPVTGRSRTGGGSGGPREGAHPRNNRPPVGSGSGNREREWGQEY